MRRAGVTVDDQHHATDDVVVVDVEHPHHVDVDVLDVEHHTRLVDHDVEPGARRGMTHSCASESASTVPHMSDTSSSKVAVVAKLLVQPGKVDEAVAVLSRLVDAANDEAGTEMYVLHTAKDDPEAVWFYELYRDDDALTVHSTSPAGREVFGDLGPLLAGPAELHVLVPVKGKGLG